MNNRFWMGKTSECRNDGTAGYDSSRKVELKRSQQWFMDGPEAEPFPNKRPAIGVPTSNLLPGIFNSNVSQWSGTSRFQSTSGPFTERLFDTDTAGTANFDTSNISSESSGKVNIGKKVDSNMFGNDSAFALSMSYPVHDSRSNLGFGGIRKVKVSQVRESDNILPNSIEHGYSGVDDNTISMGHTYGKADASSMSMGLAYGKGDNIMSVSENYDMNMLAQPYSKEDQSIVMNQPYKENDSSLLIGHAFNKADNHGIPMTQANDRPDENSISMGNVYNREHGASDPLAQTYNRSSDNNSSIGQTYNEGESNVIVFGGYGDGNTNTSGRHVPGYDLLTTQPSSQKSDTSEKELVGSNTDGSALAAVSTVSGTENIKKKDDSKASKKVPLNSFPSNVRSLLSTGLFDGVPVKYVAWSQEKELHGVIKGAGYLCGCRTCNFSKVINAYEFERHANCKTKHPNSHIYFENGKTIYSIVQELRSTPQNMLFDVIQTITGSPINQKSFRIWKESFVAATRELQRIYGKDEAKPS